MAWGFESLLRHHSNSRTCKTAGPFFSPFCPFFAVFSCSLKLFSENANNNNITPKILQPQIESIKNLSQEGITPKIPAKCTLDLCKEPYADFGSIRFNLRHPLTNLARTYRWRALIDAGRFLNAHDFRIWNTLYAACDHHTIKTFCK